MFRSGLTALDQVFDTGAGIPPGSMVELYGPTDSSKTGLALWYCRTLLEEPDRAVGWVCTETNLTSQNLRWAGVDPERLVVVRQYPGLPGLEAARELVLGGCDLVVVDSVAALIGRNEETLLSTLGEGLGPLKQAVQETGAVVIFTNQERSQGGYGRVSSAGVSVALLRSLDYRVHLQTGDGLYRGGVQRGIRVYFHLTQNGKDTANWGRGGRFSCYWVEGLKDLQTALAA